MVFILLILPEVFGVLFVVGWPALYRNLIGGLHARAAQVLSLTAAGKTEEAIAMTNYHQDLNLVTAAAVILSFSLLKLSVMAKILTGNIPDWALLLNVLYLLMVLWIVWLHVKSDPAEYKDVDIKGVSPFWIGSPVWKIRVAGEWARWIFWTRLIFALVSLAISIRTAEQVLNIMGINLG